MDSDLLLEREVDLVLPRTCLLTAVRLATNLYKSNTRFLFELIQNAEDNSYSRAKAAGAEPYIKFTIRPNRIIIDSNEDGFTTDNVRAICKIGESTKIRTGSQYYIGEKGIGFKSVFMVASKVHIQSPPWSFSFKHKEGDSGMGMVTPEWESDDALLEEPLTRITLTLIDSVDLDDLLSQFDDLPSIVLLFLNKLGKIIIDEDVQENQDIHRDADGQWDEHSQDDEEFFSFDDEDEGNDDDGDGDDGDDDDEKNQNLQERQPKMRVKCITTYSCDFDQNIKRAKVTVLRHRIMRPDSYSEDYRITRKSLSNLPTGTHHDYNTAEVILGFPVHNFLGNDRPHIRPQQVYAYLPIRDFGFPVSVVEWGGFSMLTSNSSLSTQILSRRRVERISWKTREIQQYLTVWLRRLWMQWCSSVSSKFSSIVGCTTFQRMIGSQALSGLDF
jgi:hypothetical protein